MAKSPAVLFYTSDFLTGTTLMNFSQKGKYIHLLCLQHQQGHLMPEDFFSVCDPNDYKIISKFIKDENGNYFNERMELETQKREAYSHSRSNNRTTKPFKDKGNDTKKICLSYVNHMDNDNDNINSKYIKEIVEYLNSIIDTNYKPSSKIAIKNISARLKDGYTVEDFKKVIDKKSKEWLGTDFEKHLTPDTLFGNKFEIYLNQKRKKSFEEKLEEME
jgi:uncharacterized phage protein (TIGR02220 family)